MDFLYYLFNLILQFISKKDLLLLKEADTKYISFDLARTTTVITAINVKKEKSFSPRSIVIVGNIINY